mgnify:CR=1 FL=1
MIESGDLGSRRIPFGKGSLGGGICEGLNEIGLFPQKDLVEVRRRVLDIGDDLVAGLLIGGIVTAPFSALLTSKLPVRKMFIVVGIVVIIMSLITIYRSLFL